MRVLGVVQSYFPFQQRGGPVFKVRSLAEGLAKRGHAVSILTADLGLDHGNGSGGIKPKPCPFGWKSETGGVETIYLSTFGRYRALTVNPGVVGFSRASLVAYDLVHIFGLYDFLGPVVSHYCRRRAIPYVLEPMGMYRPIVRNLELKRLYHRMLGARMIGGARFLIATSDQERQELAGSTIARAAIVVRRNGIDRPETMPKRGEFRRQRGIAPDSKVVLFLGRMVSKKSPDLLIKAFAAWISRRLDGRRATLVLAGPEERDNFGSGLRSLVQKLGISANVLFVGPLYDDEKWQAYRDADVFVLPSQNENFGNAAAESAVCGTPIVVTDRCGIASYVRSAGLIIRHDQTDLEGALERLLGDDIYYRACQEGCARIADGLSWEEPLNYTEQIYRQCLSDGNLQEAAV